MPMSPRLLRNTTTAHPEALSWRNRVLANGGSVSPSTLLAVSRFCSTIDRQGLRDRFYRLNLFAGTGLAAALVPLYRNSSPGGAALGNATDSNVNLVGGDYAENSGLTAGTAGKLINTGLQTTSLPANVGHLAWSTINGSFVSSGFLAGTNNNGSYRSYCFCSGTASQSISASSGNFAEALATASAYGRWCATRTAPTALTVYRNGSSSASSATSVTSTTGGADALSVFGANGTGGARLGLHYYSIGDAVTAGQAAIIDSAFSAFLTAMGRS